MTTDLQAWQARGRYLTVGADRIFVVEVGGGAGSPVVIVHGFPGSSHDFARVAELLGAGRRVVLLDLLGFGLSDKPAVARYSLFEQADLVETVLARLDIGRCILLGHDMGDTVVAELMHRHNHGGLGFVVEQVVLTNGSIFIDLAQLTPAQRGMLRLPGRALPISPPRRLLARSLERSFSPAAPAPPGAIDALVQAIERNSGGRLLPRQNRYLLERRQHQPRWTAALVEYAGPLGLVWGALDPIATKDMPAHLLDLRPQTRVTMLPDVGHWPSLEVPERLAELVEQLLG
ncbi:alpha/beta fold hydrolase [Rhodococcus tukisamuensis]|uniref:Pimeloyl-ACP methyl ester carboxylesterase n=1 Tax=Rhodococcus tukisamuensis TaxID=168276 RepID=A0A1G7DX42_9NOCA|nr:alpha/beta hydrolase [Rhodococcus tukisamuensis]SDE56003.1 Pimeloyl-ACP methyl ester carboxylesterase [Rhodococcus tukisamuensis]